MAGPDDPTIPYQPSDGPSDPPDDPTPPIAPPPIEQPPVEPPPLDPPPMDPGDPTLVFGAPPVLPEPFPDEGSIPPPPPPIPPPPPPGGGLPPEPPLEEEGWWAQRTMGERWAIAVGIILLGILIAVLFLPDDDDEIPVGSTTTTTLIRGTTTTGAGDTTTTAEPGDTTTTAAGETTTTAAGETTTTAAPGDTTTTTAGGDTTTTSTTSAPTTTEALPEFPSVSGSGPDTVAFVVPDDLGAAVEVTHDGTAPFVVRALDADGDEIAVLVERVGEYTGTVGVNLDSDDGPVASLEFIADGDWSAEATYVGDLDPATLGGASGGSDTVLRLDPATGGDEQFAFSHDGEREFLVIAYSADGSAADVINEFGEFAGPGVIPAGTALVTIQGDGNWTITSG